MTAEIIEHPSGRRRPDEASKRWWRPHDIPAWAVLTAAMETEAIGALGFMLDYCYMHGRLPNSDAERARICKLSGKKYARHRAQLMAHFDAEGRNQEIDATREHSKRISAVKSEAGRKGGASKSQAYARQEPQQKPSYLHQHQQPHTQLHEESDLQSSSSAPPAPPPVLPEPREQTVGQLGHEIANEVLAPLPTSARAHPGWRGLGAWIDKLLSDGVEHVDIVVGIAQCLRSLKDQPPSTFGYFTAAIHRARDARTAPVPKVARPQPEQHKLGAAGEILRKRLGDDVFVSWFVAAKVVSVLGGTVTLSTNTKFIRSHIIANYEATVLAAFKATDPSIERLVIVVGDTNG